MRIPKLLPGAVAVVLTATLTPLLIGTPATAAPPATCSDNDAHLSSVPSPESFLGFPLGIGQQRVVTNTEIRGYLSAVDKASDRVITGTMGASVLGQPLDYAVVSSKPGALDDIRSLRDPRRTRAQKARWIAANRPAIVWIAGNVHGGEA